MPRDVSVEIPRDFISLFFPDLTVDYEFLG